MYLKSFHYFTSSCTIDENLELNQRALNHAFVQFVKNEISFFCFVYIIESIDAYSYYFAEIEI